MKAGEVRSALFLQYRLPLGCLVHMTPVFEAVKRARPEIKVVVATRGLGLEVLRYSPFVDQLLETPDPTKQLWAAASSLRRQLRERGLKPDCVLTGASDQRTRIALLGMLGAGGWRGGFTQTPGLVQRPLTYDPATSLIANNLRLVKMIGCEAEIARPRVFFSAADIEKASLLLGGANEGQRPVAVFVTQASGGQRTGWHVERFAQTARHAAACGFSVLYVGTTGEAARIETLRAAADGVGTSIAGKTSVTGLAALLAMSDVMVTLDTGTMHVGRAVGTPMVVLGPSWQRPIEWLPLGVENVRILRGEDRDSVPADYLLDEITAESAMAAFDELMQAHPPSAAQRERRVSEGMSATDHSA